MARQAAKPHMVLHDLAKLQQHKLETHLEQLALKSPAGLFALLACGSKKGFDRAASCIPPTATAAWLHWEYTLHFEVWLASLLALAHAQRMCLLQRPAACELPVVLLYLQKDQAVRVSWENKLVNADGTYLQHILKDSIDQTIHWYVHKTTCRAERWSMSETSHES